MFYQIVGMIDVKEGSFSDLILIEAHLISWSYSFYWTLLHLLDLAVHSFIFIRFLIDFFKLTKDLGAVVNTHLFNNRGDVAFCCAFSDV